MTTEECMLKASEWIENKKKDLGIESCKYSFITTGHSGGATVSVSFIDDDEINDDLKEMHTILNNTQNVFVRDALMSAYFDLMGEFEVDTIEFKKDLD